MYSGYLPVLGTTKNLHYIYLDSQSDPINDPLVVWYNGGPGCSSMLGLVQEHGPYIMDNGGNSFHWNDYSWNREANMLYIEAPAGVGYSYCIDPRDCEQFDDNNSAEDNLNALLYFFEYKFPERKKNDLYISGESYAGIYVPYLVNQLD
jgi:carboxypeptidase C (cathepsin A)